MHLNGKAVGAAMALAALAAPLSADIATAPAAPMAPAATPISAGDLQFFEARIRPILADRCYKCHSRLADKIKGGLMLDTREGMLHGGDTGPAIAPGKPADSLIIDAISYRDNDLQMPPKGDRDVYKRQGRARPRGRPRARFACPRCWEAGGSVPCPGGRGCRPARPPSGRGSGPR